MIKLENITKNFGKVCALKDINLKLNNREIVVVIGSSGSGKSTLLRTVNFLAEPTTGDVYIRDKKLTHQNKGDLCFRIGMVFQQFNLFPHMSVLDNLIYGPKYVLKQLKQDAKNKANELLKKFGLLDKINSMPTELSGGQKQRVAICRALMMNPDMLLFDEPTSALDPEVIKDIINIMKDLKKDMGMMIITHQIKFASIIADRIIFMDNGLILSDQPAEEFFKKPNSHRARLFLANVADLI